MTLAYIMAIHIPTPTYCHTASYMFFIVDPDICSHTRDFTTVKA